MGRVGTGLAAVAGALSARQLTIIKQAYDVLLYTSFSHVNPGSLAGTNRPGSIKVEKKLGTSYEIVVKQPTIPAKSAGIVGCFTLNRFPAAKVPG